MSEPVLPESSMTQANDTGPGTDASARIRLQAAFAAETPADIRERVLDAVFAVLNGHDDD